VLALALLAASVFFLLLARGLWFFGDDWSFLLHRTGTLGGPKGLLEPHNEHWVTFPVIAYRVMFALFGMRHFLPYAAMPVVVHVAICALLFVRLRRSGVPAWHSVLATVVLAFLGSGAENLLWSFQIAFLGSAAWGLAALLALDAATTDRIRMPGVWLALTISLMCSGMALPMVVWVGCLALLTRGVLVAVTATGPPVLLYLVWDLTYGRHGQAQAPRPDPAQFLDFLRVGLTRVWSTPDLPVLGIGLLVVLVLVGVFGRVERRLHALAVSGILTLAATYALLGYTRGGFGPLAPLGGRYAYFGVLFTLPAFAVTTVVVGRALAQRPVVRIAAGTLVAVVFVASGCAQAVVFRDIREALVGDLRARAAASVLLVRSGEPLLSSQVDPLYAAPLDVASLRRREIQDALPQVSVGPRARLDARAALQVAASTHRLPLPVAESLTGSRGLQHVVVVGSCSTGTADGDAWASVTGGAAGVQFALTQAKDLLDTTLGTAGRRRSAAISRPVTPDSRVWVGTSVPGATLSVSVPPGRFVLCLAGPG